jgi:translocation and assembly module TamB
VALVAIVLIAANVKPGQDLIAREAGPLSGGLVALDGISGRFPDALRIRRIEVRDAQGVWLTVNDAVLDWSPSRLIGRVASIQTLTTSKIELPRLPASSGAPSQPSSGGGFTLPFRVDVDRLHVDALDVGAALAGQAASLAVDGTGQVAGSLQAGRAKLAIKRLDGPGTYDVDGEVSDARIAAHVTASEPARGLISQLASLPDLGAIEVRIDADGPREAIGAKAAVTAGELRADARGTVDLAGSAADLTVTASAPAMRPRPDIAWRSVAVDAHVTGPFTKPNAAGTIRVEGLEAPDTTVARIAADISGNAGAVGLKARVEGLRLPGPKPDLFEADPIDLAAAIRLDQADKPTTFSLDHPLITVKGDATLGDVVRAHVAIASANLGPFGQAGGIDLQGRTDVTVDATVQGETTKVEGRGTVSVTGGQAPIPGLLGDAAKLDVAATVVGSDVAIDRLTVDGRTLNVSAKGGLQGGVIGLDLNVALSDLAALTPQVAGKLALASRIAGPQDAFDVDATVTGEVAAKAARTGPIKAVIAARGLPGSPSGTVTVQGALDGAAVDLAADATRAADGALHVAISRGTWKSLSLGGALDLPAGEKIPVGKVDVKFARLADLAALTGMQLAGAIDAELQNDAHEARVALHARAAGLSGTASVAKADLAATIADPASHPVIDARLTADGIAAGDIGGSARLDAKGGLDALALKLTATAENVAGGDATLSTDALLNVDGKVATVRTLEATAKGETARLLAPVKISFGAGLAVDRLRVGLRQAVLEAAGRISPTLDLTASLRNVTADLATIADPDIKADGRLSADARLTGTTAHPSGTIKVDASGLRQRSGPAQTLPPGSLTATATLSGGSARIDARADAGPKLGATVSGTAPLDATGALALRADAHVDLALLDPILGADGQRARGQATLAATVAGTTSDPRVSGSLKLANGEVQDFTKGAHLTDIVADIESDGQTVRIMNFTGKAGPGTIALTGSAGLAGTRPVDVTFTARDAQPLSSDQATVKLNADVNVRGALADKLAASGKVDITRADIRIPERLPTDVPVLNVRNLQPIAAPGPRKKAAPKPAPDAVAAPPPSGPEIDLALTVTASKVFVRGRGLDAEMAGEIKIGGTAANPVPSGAFQMRYGTLSLAGQTLNFTKGEVGFNGAGIADPTIDFVATAVSSGTTANLEISGSASAPKISLTSTPELPQDEVLARLLFGKSASSLSPLEIAQIAAALASLTGVGPSGDPLDAIRQGLGLDRLSVGGDSSGNPALTAGRYVAPGIFVGAKQGASSGSTQATVQVDLYKGLKAEATAGTGGGQATGSSSGPGVASAGGSSVGLTYQFEY